MIDQLEPFQCSISDLRPLFAEFMPTAKQLVVSGQVTPVSWLCELPPGGASSTQLEPLHSSTSV
jgi:hypothetical protein